jgi:hypothetical protein
METGNLVNFLTQMTSDVVLRAKLDSASFLKKDPLSLRTQTEVGEWPNHFRSVVKNVVIVCC